ncbi:MAG TPA: ABC transporter permease subunit [Thermoanaerobaculia bacterium]|nr:ABC transporter permease subunit [Thermoanaerobaculia bacterium]
MRFSVDHVSSSPARSLEKRAARRGGTFLWLVRKEVWERRLDHRLAIGVSVCILLALFSALTQLHAIRGAREEESARRSRWLAGIEEQLQRDEDLEVDGFRSMSPAAVLANGLEAVLPVRFTSTKDGLHWGEGRGALNLGAALFGTFDLTFVVGTLFSLLTVLLTYDSVCGERSLGTLALLLSYPVSRSSVLLAKVVASAVLICSGLTVAFLVVLLSAVFSGIPLINLTNWLGFWCLASATLTAWAALGVAVSVHVRRPPTAALVGLLLWVVGVFLVPRTVGMVVDQLNPPRRLIELSLQEDEEVSRLRSHYRRELETAFAAFVRGSASDNDRHADLDRARKQAQDKLDRSRRQVQERLWAETERFERERDVTTTIISLLSPEALFRQSAAELSWTGYSQRHHFYSSVRQYHQQIGSRLAESRQEFFLASSGGRGQAMIWHAAIDSLLIPFTTTWASGREVFDEVLLPAAALALYGPLFFAIGMWGFRRLEIRS